MPLVSPRAKEFEIDNTWVSKFLQIHFCSKYPECRLFPPFGIEIGKFKWSQGLVAYTRFAPSKIATSQSGFIIRILFMAIFVFWRKKCVQKNSQEKNI